MMVRLSDSQITQIEKKLNAKCDFIDWRYDLYYFESDTKKYIVDGDGDIINEVTK